jgi:hypothetical protein
MRVAILALALAACSVESYTELPGQALAVDLAWPAVGGAGAPPSVRWVDGESCQGLWPSMRLGDICADGYWDDGVATLVKVAPGRLPFADSALVHEFTHAALEFNDGDPDAGHVRVGWSAVAPAVAMLREAGL